MTGSVGDPGDSKGEDVANYMLIYSGGPGMQMDPGMPPKVVAEWGAWYERMGSAVVDGGAPFADSKHPKGRGIEDGPLGDPPATDYTVISADSLEAAASAGEDHPHIRHGGQVQVFTCIDMSAPGVAQARSCPASAHAPVRLRTG